MIKMKGLRKKLNDFVKEKGNNLGKKYLRGAHIGDYLTEEVSPRNAAMVGLSIVAPYLAGCSTAKPKAYEGSAMNIFDKYQASQNLSAEELKNAGYKTWDDFVNAYKTYQREGDADANLPERTRQGDGRRENANKANADAFADLCNKLNLKTEAKKDGVLPNPQLYLHIGPFLETRHPYDTEVDHVDPYTLTGFKLDLGLDKTFGGYFTAFGGSHSNIDMDNVNNGTGISEIESDLTTFGLGGGINLFSNPYFRLGLEGGMLRNWESIDGTFTDTHGNTRDIGASDYLDGYFLGAKATWKPFDWMALTFGADNTWFAKDESDNERRQWATNFALTFGGKF